MGEGSNVIVVGVDGSECSQAALEFALREAKAFGVELRAVLVWEDPWAIAGAPSLFGLGHGGRAQLEGTLADVVKRAIAETGATDVPVRQLLLPGHPADVLVDQSASARLLVVGTSGRSGMTRALLGSVSQRCAQLSRVPVVIVPHPAHVATPA